MCVEREREGQEGKDRSTCWEGMRGRHRFRREGQPRARTTEGKDETRDQGDGTVQKREGLDQQRWLENPSAHSIGHPSEIQRKSIGNPQDIKGNPKDIRRKSIGTPWGVHRTSKGHPQDIRRTSTGIS